MNAPYYLPATDWSRILLRRQFDPSVPKPIVNDPECLLFASRHFFS
jgi:hypothetical protein